MEDERDNQPVDEVVDGEENAENKDGRDDEFDYDEDGNIIIPDVIDEDVASEDEIADIEQDETGDEGSNENEGSDEQDESDVDVQPAADNGEKKPAVDDEYKRKYDELVAQTRKTLTSLGAKDTDDVMAGLETVAAEADGVPVEDYRKAKREAAAADEAQRILQRQEFERKAAADLAELKQYYPELKDVKTIYEIKNLAEFGRLRDLGVSARQAYAAANADEIKESAARSVKQQARNDKSHLQSAVPKGSKDNSITMTKGELSQWRDLFPDKTDKEILALYKKTK